MKALRKRPGSALQRATGREEEIEVQSNLHSQVYATCGEIQTRHVRNRCGVSDKHARLIAMLFFREGA